MKSKFGSGVSDENLALRCAINVKYTSGEDLV